MKKNLFYNKERFGYEKYIALTLILLCIFIFLENEKKIIEHCSFFKENYLNLFKHKTKKMMTKNTDIKLNEMPTWDLNDLYNSINDVKIDADIEILDKKIVNFNKEYKNKIARTDATQFYNALIEYEGISELMGKLGSFAYLKYAENLSIEENVKFYQKISEILTNFSSRLVFFTVEINELTDRAIKNRLNQHKALDKYYGTFVKNLRLYKPHQLSLELEEYSTEKNITGPQAWSRLFDETIDGMIFEFDGKKLNQSEILEIVNGKDQTKRKQAGKIFGEKLGENIKLLAYITNILAKDKSIEDKWRKFENPIQARNLSNIIEDDVVEALYESVQNNYENISHRYYKLKAKILNKNKLHYTDRNAPLPFDNDTIYTWEEAKNIVLNAYNDFSPKMAEIGKLFFDNNWIDVPTRAGKRGGAFMHPTVPSVHPYILLNYQGKVRDIMTLAHELGHGIHQYLSKNQGYFMSDTPLTLAETASVFGEQLVFRYLLKNETDSKKKIAIIANKIEDMINTVIRQIAFLEFEKTVHNERKNGEISVERLNEIWINVQKKSLGDIFEYSEEYKYYWAYIPHFIHSPFYVYAYSFGDCLVNSLFFQFMKNPENFQNKYIEMLTAGGSKKYDELLESFSLNPHNKDFWQNGMNMIISLISDLEKML